MRISDWSSDVCSSDLAKGPITVRHLLTHTAGLTAASINGNFVARAYREMGLIPSLRNIATDPPRAPSLSAFADRLAMVPLIADPGARWHYGVGLDLLGAVIERASDRKSTRLNSSH